jgi:hypothetical protein
MLDPDRTPEIAKVVRYSVRNTIWEALVLSVAVIFFTFALGAWVIGLYLIGMGSQPAEGGQDPIKMVGWVELIVGLILTTQVFVLVQQSSLSPIGGLNVVLAGLVLLFAIFFSAFGIALIKGGDLRVIGNLAIPVGILAGSYMSFDLFDGTFMFQSSTIVWLVVFLMVAGFTYGKVPAKILGYALILTALWGFAPVVYLALDRVPF